MVDEIGAGTDGSDFKFGSLKTYARLLEGISFSRFEIIFFVRDWSPPAFIGRNLIILL